MKDWEYFHELCRLRSTLEAFAAQQWRRRGERRRVAEQLRPLLASLKQQAAQGNYPVFHKIDHQFHRMMVVAAGLEPLLQSWDIVAADLDQWILEVKQSYWPNLAALYREHELLLDAWQSEDDWVAEEATHQHLEAGWHRLTMAEGRRSEHLTPVQLAMSFIATHYASPLDMAWVARHVSFVSASHLTRLFRGQLGTTPLRYLKQVRLERAAQLLRSGTDAVALVAQRVGYRNTSHFVREFHRLFGVTPLDYRRQGNPA